MENSKSDRRPFEIGFGVPPAFWRGSNHERKRLLEAAHSEGFDHLVVSDHVAFRGGRGRDGLTQAAMLSMLTDLPIHVGVLLLGLRHPTLVARQAIDIVEQSSCDLVIGVGVGGEDPEEYTMCGIDPATRGGRVDEALPLLRQLLDGEQANHQGDHYSVRGPGLRRTSINSIQITVGGGAAPALRRAADQDGWLGAFCDVPTWTLRAAAVVEHARNVPSLGLQIWAGIDDNETTARRLVEDELERFYGIPGRIFERFTPAGTADSLVEFATPYCAVGLTRLNVFAVGDDPVVAARVLGEAARRLKADHTP